MMTNDDINKRLTRLMACGQQQLATGDLDFSLREDLIYFPAFAQALQRIATLHFRGLNANAPGGFLLTGQSGAGKTTLLKNYKKYFPDEELTDRKNIPVLIVSTPPAPSVKRLSEAILNAFNDPAAAKGASEDKRPRILHFIEECGVQLICIDEFQHFVDFKNRAEARHVTDWLKMLIDQARVPVVLAGLPRSERVIRANPQLARRFSSRYYLRPFEFDADHEQAEFRAILKKFHEKLPIPCPDLHEANLARRFYYASCGLIDYIVKILEKSVVLASLRGWERIDLPVFAEAFQEEVWQNVPPRLNPFQGDAVFRLLRLPGEPFDNWDDYQIFEAVRAMAKKR